MHIQKGKELNHFPVFTKLVIYEMGKGQQGAFL
jgi:hypothetical protein